MSPKSRFSYDFYNHKHPATINGERTKNTETAHNDVESSQRIEGELPEPTGGEKTAENLTRNRPINAD